MSGDASACGSTRLPDTETLRRAALQASWQRDREVGRRRLRWRWAMWVLTRTVLPAGALVLLMAAAYALHQHFLDQPADAAGADATVPLGSPSGVAAATSAAAATAAASAPELAPAPGSVASKASAASAAPGLAVASAASAPPQGAEGTVSTTPAAPQLRLDLDPRSASPEARPTLPPVGEPAR